MQLRDLFDYKNQLMQDLLTNEKIVKLIDRDVSLEEGTESFFCLFKFKHKRFFDCSN